MRKLGKHFKAALFDLDGVILDTESQYSVFWGMMGREFQPNVPNFADRIKGQTLVQIFDAWFPEDIEKQKTITCRLNEYEAQMGFPYIIGTCAYIEELRKRRILTAIVTSSNRPKMECVYHAHPELKSLFDCILTAEDFTESKPSPQCYLRAAKALGIAIADCVVFEDSLNGLKSGKDSGAYVVGVATTNSKEQIAQLCDFVIQNFEDEALK